MSRPRSARRRASWPRLVFAVALALVAPGAATEGAGADERLGSAEREFFGTRRRILVRGGGDAA